MSRRPEYIIVGRFGRPRNVSGEIYITPATDDPARFNELTEVYVDRDGRRVRLVLERVKTIGGRPVMKIEGISSREEAAALTNLSIEIPLEKARPLPEGSYYPFDLVGCRLVGNDGTDYGVIEDVESYPANDLYRVRSERFGTVLFPAVDRFIIRVDLDKSEIIVDPPGGLFEDKTDA